MKQSLEAVRFSGAGLFFSAAAVLALLSGVSVWAYLRAAVPTEQVLIVSRDLPPGTVITSADLATMALPREAVPKGALRDEEAVLAKRVRYGMVEGDIIRPAHLVEGSSDVARTLEQHGADYRAVILPAELVPSATRLVPGDRLELTGVLPLQEERSSTQVAVHVAVATVLDILGEEEGGKSAVLVAVRSGDVSRLALTMRAGSLTVAVLGTGEQSEPAPRMRLDEITGTPAQTRP